MSHPALMLQGSCRHGEAERIQLREGLFGIRGGLLQSRGGLFWHESRPGTDLVNNAQPEDRWWQLTSETDSRVAFSLGANLGDREAALTHAVERLAAVTGYELAAASEIYETDPVGGPDQPKYLNQVVVLRALDEPTVANTDYRADALLNVCHSIERDLRRERTDRWGPRTLDVDILAVGDLVLDSPDLTIPHPRLAQRAFVLIPWSEVDPTFVVPGRASIQELAERLTKSDRRSVRSCLRPG